MAAEQKTEDLYKLSCEIVGHSADVRAVKYCPVAGYPRGHVLLTASRDGTACVWEPEVLSPRDYILKKTVRKHVGYVTALCVVPVDKATGRTQVSFATGGQDGVMLVHSLDPDIQEPIGRYTGHKSMISCIIYQHGQLVSGSWDSTVRVWKEEGQSEVLEAHKPAVWTIAGLYDFDNSRRILSGGADKIIRLWEIDTKLCLQEYRGHKDVIRDVKIASKDAFFSAANDCVIRKWSLHSGHCLSELYGHEAFVYSLSLLPERGEDEFVSSGEDKTVRVWKGGVCVQVIRIPAISVWTVCCMGNGDIASGSSDGVARVFTPSPDRMASPEELKAYDTKVMEMRSSDSEKIDVSKLPGPEALSRPGRAGGDTLVINNNGNAEVYQWSGEDAQWVLIGNAVGKAPDKPNTYNGREYDYVFDIELDEGSPSMRKLKLPYNRTTDPFVAAEDFLSTNNLPVYYLDQVAEFIIKNAGDYQGAVESTQGDPFTGGSRYIPDGGGTRGGSSSSSSDPFTGGSRYQPGSGGRMGGASNRGGGADPFTGGSSYRPSEFSNDQPQFNVSFKGGSTSTNSFFPMSNYKLFTSPPDYCTKVLGKIEEFNSNINKDLKFSESQLQRLKGLCSALFECSQMETSDLSLVELMLQWPSQCMFPGLDLVRLFLVNSQGSAHFIGDVKKGQSFLEVLMNHAIDESQPKNQVPVLRALANFFAHNVGIQVMVSLKKWVLEKLTVLFTTTNRTSQIALSTIVLNYCHYYGGSIDDALGVRECTQFALKILNSTYDLEAKFRALIGIGTMSLANKSLLISSFPLEDLVSVIHPFTTVEDPAKVSQCSKCVLQALK